MARVTTKPTVTTFVLELTEAEAQYVHAALRGATPTYDLGEGEGVDTVWDGLHEAMIDARVSTATEATVR